MADRDVRVVFRKYDGSLHWHFTAWRLGEDEHGVWLGVPMGGSVRRGDDPPVPVEHAQVGLVPRLAGECDNLKWPHLRA